MKRLACAIAVLLLLAFVAVSARRRPNAQGPSETETPAEASSSSVSLEEARELFPQAAEVAAGDGGLCEVRGDGGLLGYAMKSAPYSDEIGGFMGPTPLLIALGADGKVCKVVALPNEETPPFFEKVLSSGLLEAWNGLTPAEAASKEVAAVTGATFSSGSVIASLQARLAVVGEVQARPSASAPKAGGRRLAADIVLLALTALSVAAFFRPALVGRGRTALLLASVLLLGFWQGRMLSLAQLLAWLSSGVPWAVQWSIIIVLVLSVVLPLAFGRAYYCAWLCPFGAAQELVGKLNPRHKLPLGAKAVRVLQTLRTAILFGGLLLVALGVGFDFARIEPFTAFHPATAPIAALAVGAVSLALAVWVPRPWCRFLCPLGELLELARRPQKNI